MDIRVLLLESSDFFGRAIKYRIETDLGYQVLWYKSLQKFKNSDHDYANIDLGIVNYILKDTEEGEILNFCHEIKLPVILLADEITHNIQEKIWSLKIIDYIITGSSHTMASLIDVTKRYFNNPKIGILLVDNSLESRNNLSILLRKHRYKIYEASTGSEALEMLTYNYDKIQMVITDYILVDLDGIQLTQKIRESFPVDRLAIIGISAQGNHTLKIQFIKNGANDFLTKPFISELLYCRITQNLKLVEYFKKIKDLAIIDELTQLNNRLFLKETGTFFFENAKRHKLSLVAGMIDIDNFKKVNDKYGHDAGDMVLKEVSKILKAYVRKSDLAIRFGGEEFLIIGNNLDPNSAKLYFNKLREQIESKNINIGLETINVTISIGVCIEIKDSLEEVIIYADKKLYKAKSLGKNRVCL